MQPKKIFNSSGYEQALQTILLGIVGDKMKVRMGDSSGGAVWESNCKEVENTYGRFNVTTIKKNGRVVGKFVHNYDTQGEEEFVYDRITKKFINVSDEK